MIDLTDRQLDDYAGVLPRGRFDVDQAVAAVRPICDAVRDEGRGALARFITPCRRIGTGRRLIVRRLRIEGCLP